MPRKEKESQPIFPKLTYDHLETLVPKDFTPTGKIEFVDQRRLHYVMKASFQDKIDMHKEERLNSLLKKERKEVKNLESAGFSSKNIAEIRQNHDIAKEIKTLLVDLGIARLLTKGDWIINRKQEIPNGLGVIPFTRLMDLISKFHDTHCTTSDGYSNDQDYPLMGLDAGCGDGEFLEVLRREQHDLNTRNWMLNGYADRLYFTLNGFLKNCLKDVYQENDTIQEFVDVISTLLIREIYKLNMIRNKRKSYEDENLLGLELDVDVIRKILPKLEKYIKLKGRKRMKIDLEFLSDAERALTDECQKLIEEYFKSPDEFIDKFFIKQVKDLTDKDRTRLQEIDQEIEKIRRKYRDKRASQRITKKLKVPETGFPKPDKRKGRITMEIEDKLLALQEEKTNILERTPSLSEYISLYHYNIIPAEFKDFSKIFPRSSLHFIWSFRATSHLNDKDYIKNIKNIVKHLAPGGIFLDDGMRETWSRFERIEAFETLQKELGQQYRVRIIAEGDNAKSLLLEKGVVQDDTVLFFSDEYGEEMLKEGSEFIEIDEWKVKLPQILIRNKIIDVLRESFTEQGKLNFREAHSIIDEEFGRLFDKTVWDYLIEIDGELSPNVMKLVNTVSEKIENIVKGKMEYFHEGRAVLLKSNKTIQTLPNPKAVFQGGYDINEPRLFPATILPRNLDMPTTKDIIMRTFELVKGLKSLEIAFKKPPINVIEYDNCFTNKLMIDTLKKILHDACFTYDIDFSELVEITNNYPETASLINIFGGSTDSAYGKKGRLYTEKHCLPMLEGIQKGESKRILAICFGKQIIEQAYGLLIGEDIRTVPGAYQYGNFPVEFTNDEQFKPLLKELLGTTVTTCWTRGDYTLVPEKISDRAKVIAYEVNCNEYKLKRDKNIPPPALSLLDGKVITAQFHPEIPPNDPNLLRSEVKKNPLVKLSDDEVTRQFDIQARDEKGVTQWVKNDIGPIFLINVLTNHVNSLLKELDIRV